MSCNIIRNVSCRSRSELILTWFFQFCRFQYNSHKKLCRLLTVDFFSSVLLNLRRKIISARINQMCVVYQLLGIIWIWATVEMMYGYNLVLGNLWRSFSRHQPIVNCKSTAYELTINLLLMIMHGGHKLNRGNIG